MSFLKRAMNVVLATEPRLLVGSVQSIRGLTLVVDRLRLPIGSLVDVDTGGRERAMGEVIGFDGPRSLIMLYGSPTGLAPGAAVRALRAAPTVAVGRAWLGRTLDALGRPIDGGPPLDDLDHRLLDPPIVNPLSRGIIKDPLPTGVRAIDAFLTVGKGQRVGIFAGPGVGKSTLLASIAKGTTADVAVIGLIGERGREVKEFIEHTLGPAGRKRAVVVAATGDESPLLRVRAAVTAITAAEHFRDEGKDVLLMLDSVTRLAQAQRQIGLAAGEQPATKGYTPSVFALLPRLLERAGPLERRGSITGFYTVLVEGDDLTEPIADATKGILDGHIVLTRKIASRGFYPSIDLLDSISRLADLVSDANHRAARRELIKLLAAYRENEELISIGAYVTGTNPDVDVARLIRSKLEQFLQQDKDEISDYPKTLRGLMELAMAAEGFRKSPQPVQAAVPANAAPRPQRPAAAQQPQAAAPRGR